jgi:hypothetical protein
LVVLLKQFGALSQGGTLDTRFLAAVASLSGGEPERVRATVWEGYGTQNMGYYCCGKVIWKNRMDVGPCVIEGALSTFGRNGPSGAANVGMRTKRNSSIFSWI